nr:MAG TPA: ribosome, girodazole, girolline, antibiotic complex, 50S [Caudoviricetes sp.]
MSKTRFSISNNAPETPMIGEREKKLETAEMDCPMCGGKMIVTVSRYNGHKSGHCKKCGARFME